MRSTGEVMGLDADLGIAYAKAQMSAQPPLPESGTVFISVKDADKNQAVTIAREFVEAGLAFVPQRGRCAVLKEAGVPVRLFTS